MGIGELGAPIEMLQPAAIVDTKDVAAGLADQGEDARSTIMVDLAAFERERWLA